MNAILAKQLAFDFCCTEDDVRSGKNIFTEFTADKNRRIFEDTEDCFLKIASVNGKLLATGESSVIAWCREKYHSFNGEWFMEVENFRELDRKVMEYGYRIGQAHPFYIGTEYSEVDTKGLEIRKFLAEEIERFRDDNRFGEAFIFAGLPRDEIGIGAYQDGKILGMAGATSDSPLMWQIGINVLPEAKGLGIGTMLVKLLKNEILSLGKLPFYGTAVSHIASQRVALNAGFVPAWSELYCEKI